MNSEVQIATNVVEFHKKDNGEIETGPNYSVRLPDSFPLNSGGMRQAAPRRAELVRCNERFPRVAAAYEMAVAHLQVAVAHLNQTKSDLQSRKFVLVTNVNCFSSDIDNTAIAFKSKEDAYSYAASFLRSHDPDTANTRECKAAKDDQTFVQQWLLYQTPYTIFDVFELIQPVEVASTGTKDGEQ